MKSLKLQGVQDQIFQKELAVAPSQCISDPKLVNAKWVSSPNISYSKNIFFKNLENFCKMKKKALVVWDEIRTHNLLITSLVLKPLHYRTKLETIGQSCWSYSKSSKNPLLANEMFGNETHLVFTYLGSEMHSKGGTANSFLENLILDTLYKKQT